MKLLAIVKTGEFGNTMQIAEAMSEVAPLTVAPFEDLKYYNPAEYDAVGFASGIDAGSHDRELIKYVEKLENVPKYSFVFSTSATKAYARHNRKLINLLKKKGSNVVGSFGCRGYCNFFIFKLFGGINKGHPNSDDFDAAQAFIEGVTEKVRALKENV